MAEMNIVSSPLTCCASGCTNTSESERVMKCTFPQCDQTYCVRCFEQITHPESHEFACVCEGQEGLCLAEAIWECQEENIVYCEECFKDEHKGRRKSHSKVKLTRKKARNVAESTSSLHSPSSPSYPSVPSSIWLASPLDPLLLLLCLPFSLLLLFC
jgi:hypothetical protein